MGRRTALTLLAVALSTSLVWGHFALAANHTPPSVSNASEDAVFVEEVAAQSSPRAAPPPTRGGGGECLPASSATLQQSYIPLVFIPFFSERDRTLSYTAVLDPGQLPVLVHTFYYLLLGLLAVAAVVLITYYGLSYTLSEVVPEKVDAKGRIVNILLGFTIIIGTYVIINTINPAILSLDILGEGSAAAQQRVANTCVPAGALNLSEGPEGSVLNNPQQEQGATPI